ncbi:MAG TPA: hypothetical protein VF502_05325 [Stellaceae bacterium]
MADYRVYFLNQSGSIRRRLDLTCRDDWDACAAGERALLASDFSGVEVWQRARFIERRDRRQLARGGAKRRSA